ncbi:MAG: thioredoxin domain-containing protein [Candidatus Nomurabacteria bacterium]|jgi:protein-disulfide isomerase|nr:thioredoxin domain-containing protein [Candidatus Nomurabacteria bacterium]
MGKSWIIFGVIVVVFVGLFVLASSSNKKVDVSNVNIDKIQPADDQNGQIADHVLGNKNSKVVIIEYGDYECYGCSTLAPRMSEIMEEYKDQVAFVYRNFIIQGHVNSRAASTAAEAAGFQGKYWEMHDALFKDRSLWIGADINGRTEAFMTLAKQIGIDANKLKEDMESSRTSAKIDFDLALGKKQDVSATPSVYVNGKNIDGDTLGSDEKLKAYLNEKLKEFGIKPPTAKEESKDK